MKSIVRVAAVSHRIKNGSVSTCLEEALRITKSAAELGADLVVLPSSPFCGSGCGTLLRNKAFFTAVADAADAFAAAVSELGCCVATGLPSGKGEELLPALFCRGRIITPETLCGEPFVFSVGELRFTILCGPLTPSMIPALTEADCDLAALPSAMPAVGGSTAAMKELCTALSRSMGTAFALANAGVGETSSPQVYKAFTGIVECGEVLDFKESCHDPILSICDVDCDLIRSRRGGTFRPAPCAVKAEENPAKHGILRKIPRCPYLPADEKQADILLSEWFELQVKSLHDRLFNTGISHLVIGVSGGLDSTLALLVAAKALDLLALPRRSLIAVTMPGFGTTDRTYYNALGLISSLGAESFDIPIRAAATQHFEDIGHSLSRHDVVYENAQARERTKILMSLANKFGGIVVGTGDLSEEALGFSTFGGDQFAHFNVNADLPKTIVRKVTDLLCRQNVFPESTDLLRDILDTPVSPELLPPDEKGEQTQKTEQILGPYELHDFFLYYFLYGGFAPGKILQYACAAFDGEHEKQYIRDTLRLFLRRFCQNHYKRASSPEGARISLVSAGPLGLSMAGDFSAETLLSELDRFEF